MTAARPGEQSSLERALDLLVYAPLGLVFTARDELPRLVAKGRQGASGQVGMARIVGEFAVNRGHKEAERLLRQATARLADLGLVPDPAARPPPTSPPERSPASPSARPPAPARSSAAGSLAIPGYDSLSAPQVVQRLDGLSADELESVRTYEAATRGRKTILSRVAQLQSSP